MQTSYESLYSSYKWYAHDDRFPVLIDKQPTLFLLRTYRMMRRTFCFTTVNLVVETGAGPSTATKIIVTCECEPQN